MSNNNNKQPQDLTESLLVSDKAQAPSTTTPTVNKQDYDGINLVERRSRDVTMRNLSRSDELTIDFLLDCAKRGQNRGTQRPPSICKVSRILRDHSKSSYEPQLVSIGPIHREDPKLKEFEWLKERYLDHLLNRCNSMPKETLEACLQKVNDLMPQIRESYAGVMKNYSDVELARMMVMDGCFILEFCFNHQDKDEYLPNKMQNLRIAMDLMLLENQVPFFVLQALFDCSMGEVPFTLNDVLDAYLAPYIRLFCSDLLPEKNSILSNVLHKYLAHYIKLFCSLLPENISTTDAESDLPKKISTTDVDSDSTPAHVLGYLHKRHQLVDEERIENTHTSFHSIVELDRSGMNVKPHQEDEWSMTIKFQSSRFACLPWFWGKPTLLMPTLVIADETELILRNFIAYEQLFPHVRHYFTSYAVAMDKLIDTQEDIAKLVESKVLVNDLGSNQEAADMINKMCKNIFCEDFYYKQVFIQMDKYYNCFWPKHIARLRRVYFSNPWSAIALFVGIIVFLATVVSAIFAVLDYFR